MTTLAAFLSARLDEDEAMARAATSGPWEWTGDYPAGTCPHNSEWTDHGPDLVTVAGTQKANAHESWVEPDAYVISSSGYDASSLGISDEDAAHIARHDPARVLADVAAKRAIVALHGDRDRRGFVVCTECESQSLPCATLLMLAQPFAAHPDFDAAWSL